MILIWMLLFEKKKKKNETIINEYKRGIFVLKKFSVQNFID